MASPNAAAAALAEQFCELAIARARELSGRRDLDYTGPDKRGFWAFHCPLPGPDADPHGHNGSPHAWVKVTAAGLQAGCSKCSRGKADPAYLEAVKAAIGWTEDNVARPEFGAATYRHHEYQTSDGRWNVRHSKVVFKDGRKKPIWQWSIQDPAAAFGAYRTFKPTEFCAEHYPELKHFSLALKVYGAERFAVSTYRAVVCEGERDADTFNALMAAAGETGLIATCLPHQTPTALSASQRAVFAGRDVVLLGDLDEGGKRFVAAWGAVLWDVAASIRIFPPELLGLADGGKDLSDARAQQEAAGQSAAAIGKRLIERIAGLPVVEESMARVDWRGALAITKSTGAVRDSGGNAKVALTLHPELQGRLRFNVRSGEVEAVEAPWGDTIGAQRIATEVSIWLETGDGVHLKPKSFEEALLSTTVAPAYDPLADLGQTAWDGVPRLDGLFTRYLRLDLDAAQAVQLARLFMGDLVATLRNEPARQRVIVGIATDLELDVAGALLGRHGIQYYGGTVRERQLASFAYEQAALVQVGMTTIGDRQVARFSLPQMFAPSVRVGARHISSPVFVAVGELVADPRTAAKIDERCIVLELKSHALEALAADARQILAEAVARRAELAATPVLVRTDIMTADARDAREAARSALSLIYAYATGRPDTAVFAPPPGALARQLRDHVVRDLCLAELRMSWTAAWRDTPAQERAFNAACKAMGWFKSRRPVGLEITRKQASELGYDISGREKAWVPGVLLTDQRWQELTDYLFDDSGDGGYPPKGGKSEAGSGILVRSGSGVPEPQDQAGSEIQGSSGIMVEGIVTRERSTNDRLSTHTRAPLTTEAVPVPEPAAVRPYLDGAAAIAAVQVILAEPGICAIDFESWPADPAWHGEQAAAGAPRGAKADARERARHTAELNGRAHTRRPCVLALAHESGAEAVVRLEPGDDPAARRAELQAMFAGRRATLVAHNAQFEAETLLARGVAADFEDTLLAAKALYLVAVREDQPQPVEFGLAALVEREFGRIRDKAIRDRDWREEAALDEEAVQYARQDARDALELWRLYRTRLEADGLLEGYRLIAGAILPTAAINLAGMVFDAEAHVGLVGALRAEADRLEQELGRICGGVVANPASCPQISAWIMGEVYPGGDYVDFCGRLQARCGLTWKRTKGGALAITKALKPKMAEALAGPFPIISHYLIAHAQWTRATKLLGTFGESLAHWVDGDGRLRGQLKVGGTVTLRHSASRPNVQQMPRQAEYRALFQAPPGRRLIVCDYSQIELRLAAIIAPDQALLEVYRSGADVHLEVANAIGLPRGSQSKGVSFAMVYGAGVAGVAEAAGLSIERAAEVVELFLGAYPGLRAYRERAPLEAAAAGWIPIRPGRRVRYDLTLSSGTQAINYQVQGGAASVQMLALRRVYDALAARPELDARPVGAIHDELILEAPADERAEVAAELLQAEMRIALIEVFPEAVEMGADRLAKAVSCQSWAEKG